MRPSLRGVGEFDDAGLAGQDIALARAVCDPFGLVATPTTTSTTTIDGRTYTLTRTVSLVSQAGVDGGPHGSSTDAFVLPPTSGGSA